MDFFAKLAQAEAANHSLLCVGLDPTPARLPERFRQTHLPDGLLAWNQAVIQATQDLVCCFKPNIAFYEALGAPGMELLRKTLAAIPAHIPVLLDVKRGDIGSTATAYARACFDDLGVDAVTLSPYLGRDSILPFAQYPDKGLFVLCHTSNPNAGDLQHLEISDWQTLDREPNQPLYVHVARQAIRWAPNVGLVVGATYPDAMATVRAAAPQNWFLVPGIGAQGGDLEATLNAGLREDGSGLIINVTRSVMLADDPRTAAMDLRDQINAARASRVHAVAATAPHAAGLPMDEARRTLILALADLEAVKFGSFTLASGVQSPIYIDLRLLVSRPRILAQAAEAYSALLADLPGDRIAGVPYAALPIGTAVALAADKPLIYPRKESKNYGLGKEIEGLWQPGERVVIIEDLITSGGSTIQTAQRLRGAGLVVDDVIVLIDREQGGVEKLAQAGIRAHAVFTLSEVLEVLVDAGRLDQAKYAEVLAFIRPTKEAGA